MQPKKRKHPKVKSRLHPQNKHRARYDFKELLVSSPDLAPFVVLNKYGDESINFFDPEAVKQLNRALLIHYYDLTYWDIPEGYLCPPVPGRADYIHHLAELMSQSTDHKKVPKGDRIKCLDIGVGANCIYPIIGHKEYGWSFVGSDIDETALATANKIITENPTLEGNITLKQQSNPKNILVGIVQQGDIIDAVLCNPPFHASKEAAEEATIRKLSNLKKEKVEEVSLNFGGQHNELWYEGGERKFVRKLMLESKKFATSCFWFSSLISKKSNLDYLSSFLKSLKATDIKIIPMGQGKKTSRLLAWTFLKHKQQRTWAGTRWS